MTSDFTSIGMVPAGLLIFWHSPLLLPVLAVFLLLMNISLFDKQHHFLLYHHQCSLYACSWCPLGLPAPCLHQLSNTPYCQIILKYLNIGKFTRCCKINVCTLRIYRLHTCTDSWIDTSKQSTLSLLGPCSEESHQLSTMTMMMNVGSEQAEPIIGF